MSIPGEKQREEALTQLNKAALELSVEQRPTQSDLLYPLWWVTFARKSLRKHCVINSVSKLCWKWCDSEFT